MSEGTQASAVVPPELGEVVLGDGARIDPGVILGYKTIINKVGVM